MLRIRINKDAFRQVEYFSTSLSKDDLYYDQECKGIWKGEMAKDFDLDGKEVEKDIFRLLSFNLRPNGIGSITPITKEGRRTSIEYVWSAPKSFSLLASLTDDPRLIPAFDKSVEVAMKAVEHDMHVQKMVDGKKQYKPSQNFLYGYFRHMTSRPVVNKKNSDAPIIGEPGVHAHAVVLNASRISDGEYRALEASIVHENAIYYQSIFHSELSRRLQKMGYEIERAPNQSWEVKSKGLTRDTLLKFSTRTIEIEEFAKENNIHDIKAKSEIGARTRLSKSKATKRVNLKKEWLKRLAPKELKALQNAKGTPRPSRNPITAKDAVEQSFEHMLERKSAVRLKRLVGHALTLGYGKLSLKDINQALRERKDLVYAKRGYVGYATTRGMVRQEDQLIETAVKGKNKVKPIHPTYKPKAEFLSTEQKNAIAQILNSKDKYQILSGVSGGGKSSMLNEVLQACREEGTPVFGVAPSAAARDVLIKQGFKDSATLAKFLKEKELQKKSRSGLLICDEASMVGVKDMNTLMGIAKKQQFRLLYAGDYKQNNAVKAHDSLRILEQKAKLNVARVQKVQRQKPNPEYREAIEALAKGNVRRSFAKLESMKAVKEVPDLTERHEKIADTYISNIQAKKSCIIVSPTHKEGEMISMTIRDKLRKNDMIGKEDRKHSVLKDLSYTEAQKKDQASFEKDMVIQCHQNIKGGFKAGQKYKVLGRGLDGHVRVSHPSQKEPLQLPLSSHQRFNVYRSKDIGLSKGDLIKVTKNSKTVEGSRINNGAVFEIKSITKGGDIKLTTGKTLPKTFSNLKHAYVNTSQSVQGRTSDSVIIAQSSMSYKASNMKNWYVAASRAKSDIAIYTDDLDMLKSAISKSGDRISAKEIDQAQKRRQLAQRQRAHYLKIKHSKSHHGTSKKSFKTRLHEKLRHTFKPKPGQPKLG